MSPEERRGLYESRMEPISSRLNIFCHKLCHGSRVDAWDLYQETCIRIYNNLHTQKTDMYQWACRIAVRRFIDLCRRNKRAATIVELDKNLADKTQGEDHIIGQAAACLLVKQLIEEFGETPSGVKTVQALLLTALGEDHIEVARILNDSPGSVRNRLCRARKRIAHLSEAFSSPDLNPQ